MFGRNKLIKTICIGIFPQCYVSIASSLYIKLWNKINPSIHIVSSCYFFFFLVRPYFSNHIYRFIYWIVSFLLFQISFTVSSVLRLEKIFLISVQNDKGHFLTSAGVCMTCGYELKNTNWLKTFKRKQLMSAIWADLCYSIVTCRALLNWPQPGVE